MEDIRTPGNPGQNLESSRAVHSRPAPHSEGARARIGSDLLASIRAVGEHARRLLVAPEDDPGDLGAPLALASDGTLLVNVDYLPADVLKGEPLWVGVPVRSEHLNEARAALDAAALDVVGRTVERMTGEAEEPLKACAHAAADEKPEEHNISADR